MNNCESPRLLVAIVDRGKHKRLEGIFSEKQVSFQYLVNAMGTASSELLRAFGLSGTEKTIGICVMERYKARKVMNSLLERMEMMTPGHGVAFTLPLSAIGKSIAQVFENNERSERQEVCMDKETQELKHELVIAIVDNGFSEKVMDSARAAGARGGTVVHARQASIDETVKFFGISLQPDKEMIFIITEKAKKVELMKAIGKACGMCTNAHGVVVSLPIDECVGLTPLGTARK